MFEVIYMRIGKPVTVYSVRSDDFGNTEFLIYDPPYCWIWLDAGHFVPTEPEA